VRKNDLNVSGVYQIRNMVNGRLYVGSAVRIWSRWTIHRRQLNRGTHHSVVLQRAWNKYGEDSFDFSVLEFCDLDRLIEVEQSFIDGLSPDYNIAPSAGSQLGYRHSEESRAKMAEAARRTRNFTGKRHSEESKRRISEAKSGVSQKMDSVDKRTASIKARGVWPSSRRFTEDQVRSIREQIASGVKQVALCSLYGVSSGVISEISTRKAYGWVN
jgi:group I intron endonuclease